MRDSLMRRNHAFSLLFFAVFFFGWVDETFRPSSENRFAQRQSALSLQVCFTLPGCFALITLGVGSFLLRNSHNFGNRQFKQLFYSKGVRVDCKNLIINTALIRSRFRFW